MATALELTDPTYQPRDHHGWLDRHALKFIQDPRDLPFAHLILQILLVQVPFAVVLFALGDFPWWLGASYLAVMALGFLDRFVLMLHLTSHRRFFAKDRDWMNHLIPWFIGPFFGETPETYYGHHMGMHHPENNLPEDLSSTMRFRRDSVLGFARYFGRFFFAGIFELAAYLKRKGRMRLFRNTIVGELTFYAVVAVGLWLRPEATLVVFVIPFVMIRFLMMAGNWGQHAFVVASDPANPYLNSITCINSRYNRRCFNDGYHIGHHLKANRHWTDLPVEFWDNREEYARQDAIVFQGVDFFMIWLYLMLGRWDWMADRFVDLREEPRSREEIIALLKSRVSPIA